MISRSQWKDRFQRIKKGGIEELKAYSQSISNAALQEGFVKGIDVGTEKGVEVGIDAARKSIMIAVKNTLRKEFKFGDKRLEKFNESFTKEVRDMAQNENHNKEDEVKEENTQQVLMSENDKQRYMIYHCISEFLLQSLKVKDNYLFGDARSIHQIEVARDNIEFMLHSSANRISPEEHDKLMNELEKMTLYLAPLKYEEKTVS